MVVNDVFQEVDAEQYLRFSPARKVIIGGILSFCSFLAPISSTSILSAIPEGRRPVFLASAYLFFAFSIETSCLVVWELRVGRCTRASSTGNSIRLVFVRNPKWASLWTMHWRRYRHLPLIACDLLASGTSWRLRHASCLFRSLRNLPPSDERRHGRRDDHTHRWKVGRPYCEERIIKRGDSDIPGCTLVYGWTVEKAVRGIPVLVIAMFFQGVVQPFCFPSLNTYSLDFMYLSGRSAEVVAGSCLLRCVFGALGSGLVLPAIESMGVGWFSTISALYLLVSGVGAWLTTISGDQWRDKAERKNQRKAEESAEEVQQNTTKAEA
ncbi:Major facilitator superfamily domain, general substrate transporter [Penicillium digitatum]|uniref:Major facilitator superfamily domain, general substrate transporter n=1 Tax=Penicillium digitatum TaxID=36651 RepID=A0A7T6XHF1_PENDI|nr:Major facilitator superfamily domain, general substrate transporter [Penicillium digitatum]